MRLREFVVLAALVVSGVLVLTSSGIAGSGMTGPPASVPMHVEHPPLAPPAAATIAPEPPSLSAGTPVPAPMPQPAPASTPKSSAPSPAPAPTGGGGGGGALPPAPTPVPTNPAATALPDRGCNVKVPPETRSWKPLRWLFLQTKDDANERMDPFFHVLHTGAKTSPHVAPESVYWGPGMAGYVYSKSLKANIKAKYGDEEYFDVIFFCGDRKNVVKKEIATFVNTRVMTATRKHECRPKENCPGILASTKADLSVNVNPFEVAMNTELNKLTESMLLAHVFSPALKSMMYKPATEPRSMGAALVGAVSDSYPLRKKWVKLVETGIKGQQLKRHGHPGYWDSKSSWSDVWNEYRNRVQGAKMLLTDAAWVFYSVQKYSEAPTAGTLLMADIPHDRMREFRNIGVEVSSQMEVNQLSDTVRWWLEHPKELTNKAAAGQQWALHNVLTDHFFEQVTELYFEAVAQSHGGKGMVGRAFPEPFYIRCRGAGGEKWCKKEQKGKLPHYHNAQLPKHPRFAGPVPNVTAPPAGCPYSIAPPAYQSRWQPLRVLLLQSKQSADATTDPTFRRLMTQKDSYVYTKSLELWGPGWEGYNDTATLSVNIAAKFGDENFFDLILTDVGTLPADTAAFKDKRSVVVVKTLACREGEKCGDALSAHRPSIVHLANPFELMYNSELEALSMQSLMVHQVLPASPVSSVTGDATKNIDVLLLDKPSGYPNLAMFPMLTKWKTVIAALQAAGKTVETVVVPNGPAADADVADKLKRAKIVLTESGTARYTPEGWVDALLAKALVISDMPYDRVREFRRFSVEVSQEASAAVLQMTVEQCLGNMDLLAQKTAEGAAWAEKNAMPSNFMDDVLEAYHEVMAQPWGEGLVGKKFPWNWYASCRTHGGEAWCKRSKKTIRPHWVGQPDSGSLLSKLMGSDSGSLLSKVVG